MPVAVATPAPAAAAEEERQEEGEGRLHARLDEEPAAAGRAGGEGRGQLVVLLVIRVAGEHGIAAGLHQGAVQVRAAEGGGFGFRLRVIVDIHKLSGQKSREPTLRPRAREGSRRQPRGCQSVPGGGECSLWG